MYINGLCETNIFTRMSDEVEIWVPDKPVQYR